MENLDSFKFVINPEPVEFNGRKCIQIDIATMIQYLCLNKVLDTDIYCLAEYADSCYNKPMKTTLKLYMPMKNKEIIYNYDELKPHNFIKNIISATGCELKNTKKDDVYKYYYELETENIVNTFKHSINSDVFKEYIKDHICNNKYFSVFIDISGDIINNDNVFFIPSPLYSEKDEFENRERLFKACLIGMSSYYIKHIIKYIKCFITDIINNFNKRESGNNIIYTTDSEITKQVIENNQKIITRVLNYHGYNRYKNIDIDYVLQTRKDYEQDKTDTALKNKENLKSKLSVL